MFSILCKMTEVIRTVESIKKELKKSQNASKCATSIVGISSDSLGEDIVLAFRFLMEDAHADEAESMKLLNFGTDLAMQMTKDGVTGASCVPYEIIETLLDRCPVQKVGALWRGVEALLDKLMDPCILGVKQNNLKVLTFCITFTVK